MDEPDDAQLVEQARRGDADAFGALVRRYLRPAYAVALARTGQPADAEDVCQDAFVSALERLEDCRDPARFGGWLLTIVRHRALDRLRSAAVRSEVAGADAGLAARPSDPSREPDPLHPGADPPHPGADPLRDAERSELRGELLAGLGGLTELQREVVLLHELEGWTHPEIGRRLGISAGSARVHLHNAKRALRQRLTATGAEGP